jgi:hypothetical protein
MVADGFLGRWSRRKLDVKEGKPLPPEPPLGRPEPVQPSTEKHAAVVPAAGGPAVLPPAAAEPAPVREEPPAPTLEDVKMLTRESDYSLFARRGVDPEVRNAAMKKLFSDPHYNIMDGLDIYIDDYSKPDPIPPAMLRQLVSAEFLDLFGEKAKAAREAQEAEEREKLAQSPADSADGTDARELADNPTTQTVAQSGAPDAGTAAAERTLPDHADPDLRLQQDHASPGKDPGEGDQ